MQFAVYPEAHLHVLFLRTDMDIAAALANTLGENGVYQAHDRRFFSHSLQRADFDIIQAGCFVGALINFHFFHVFQNAADTGIGTVSGRQQLVEVLFSANDRFNFTVGIHFNRIQRIDIQRIGHGHREQQAAFFQRSRLATMRNFS